MPRRIDHVTKDQAILDLRPSSWGGHDRDHTTIVRFRNSTITSQSFNMECSGRGRSMALEDEMYMRSIFMLATDVRCDWFNLPIHKWKLTLDVAFDVTYPFMRYRNTESSWRGKARGHLGASNRARGHHYACLFMNPTRRSAMLWALSPEDYEEFSSNSEADLRASGWLPSCKLLHEFSVAPLRSVGDHQAGGFTRVSSMDEAIECVFAMGFGPCPFYRRAGVLVLGWEDHEREQMDDGNVTGSGARIGCIVPHHAAHGHGCVHCEYRQCYVCPQNPFYEVYYGRGSYPEALASHSGTRALTTRMLPARACEVRIRAPRPLPPPIPLHVRRRATLTIEEKTTHRRP